MSADECPRLDDSVVVRRIMSDKTHVAFVGPVRAGFFMRPYWAPALATIQAACGVAIPADSVIMATGTKVRCRACRHLTGIHLQSPIVAETLGVAA